MSKIVLASGSPRRRELLENIGLDFTVVCSRADESSVPTTLEPKLYVQQLAVLKANSVARAAGRQKLVIGADTVVVCDGKIFGKPSNAGEAEQMLRTFSGRTHEVITGIAVLNTDDMKIASAYERTEVSFRELTDAEIENYVLKYKPLDKAGAYGIQEYAGVFVKGINGDYFNVVGLPLCRLYMLMRDEFGEEL